MLTDTEALDRIHRLMCQIWSPDTLDDIAAVVAMTGREIAEPDDFDPDDIDGYICDDCGGGPGGDYSCRCPNL